MNQLLLFSPSVRRKGFNMQPILITSKIKPFVKFHSFLYFNQEEFWTKIRIVARRKSTTTENDRRKKNDISNKENEEDTFMDKEK